MWVLSILTLLFASHIHCDMVVKTTPQGSYQVIVNGTVWLSSFDTKFQVQNVPHSLMGKTLVQTKSPSTQTGSDIFGPYTKYVYSFKAGSALIDASVQGYTKEQLVKFTQYYRNGAVGTTVKNKDGVVSMFPSFNVGSNNVSLGVLAYGDVMAGYAQLKINKWEKGMKILPGGLNGGPLVIFDDKNNVLIISAFNHFMANSYVHDPAKNTIGWGIMGNVDFVPQDYALETSVFYSDKGINQAMQTWGRLLMKWYNRDTAARETDVSVRYLGYYTDNGGYYYRNPLKGKTYEETLLAVYEYSKQQNIPYKYFQLDDWWYYSEFSKTSYGAVTKWEAMPSVFPKGIKNFYNKTKVPFIAHNRYWSYKTPYAIQNQGDFDFIIDNDTGFALPIEERFWDYLFRRALEWGLVTYEQDWLITQINEIKELNSDILLAEKWLLQMGNAAERYNLKMQWCMTAPKHALMTLMVPVVSHTRTSMDYVTANQWRMGYTSMFVDAIGVAPFKDNMWTTSVQPGAPFGFVEVNPEREAVISLFSTGPVGISDEIGHTNVTMIKRLCNTGGLLLKPSKAATAIDQQIVQRVFGGPLHTQGEVYTTYSEVSGIRFGIILASQLNMDFKITPYTAGFNQQFGTKMVVFPLTTTIDPQMIKDFSEQNPLLLTKFNNMADMHLYYTAPVLKMGGTTVVILGDLSKYVPMSAQRMQRIEVESDDIVVTLTGEIGEQVNISMLINAKPYMVRCIIAYNMQAVLHVGEKKCTGFD